MPTAGWPPREINSVYEVSGVWYICTPDGPQPIDTTLGGDGGTANVVVANTTANGTVSTIAQSFAGVKTFVDGPVFGVAQSTTFADPQHTKVPFEWSANSAAPLSRAIVNNGSPQTTLGAVNYDSTVTSGGDQAFFARISPVGANTSADHRAGCFIAEVPVGSVQAFTSKLVGVRGRAESYTSGAQALIAGGEFITDVRASSNVAEQTAVYGGAFNLSGNVDSLIGADISVTSYNKANNAMGGQFVAYLGGGTIASAYGAVGAVVGNNNITNAYGFFCDVVQGNSHWSFFADDALSPSFFRAGFVSQLNSYAAANMSATSNTTLTNVPGLTANVLAGRTYAFEAVLHTTSDVAAGVKVAIGGTATATNIVSETLIINAGSTTQSRQSALASAAGVTAVTAALVRINGTITVNAAGTLTVQFAQNASQAAASVVLQGSKFTLQLLA